MLKKAQAKGRKKTSSAPKRLSGYKFWLLAGLAAALLALSSWAIFNHSPGGSVVKIGNETIKVDIADDETERATGLGGRESLDDDAGMWFIFDKPDNYGIWMKDMKFPIDVMWIDENYKIVGIATMTPEDPNTYHSDKPAKYILEVNDGFVEDRGIKLGDPVSFIE